MYYVYLHSPAGIELIGKGTRDVCKAIVDQQEATWKPGDLWYVELTNHQMKETNYWD